MQQRIRRGRYLDVSEYILKEYSPMSKAMSADFRQSERNQQRHPTPQIGPIDHDTSTLQITPFLNGLIELADDHLQDFLLDERSPFQGRTRERRWQGGRSRRRSNSLVLFHLENELQGIVEQSDLSMNSMSESMSSMFADEQERSCVWSQEVSVVSHQQAAVHAHYRDKLEKYLKQPKVTLLRQIRRLAQDKDELNQNQKLENIKKTIQLYIVDFQMPSFEEAWTQTALSLAQKLPIIVTGIELSFGKRIGMLTFEQRRLKLLRYLEKKRMRKWRKKVSYDCRKKVADSRLRIKGKFVTREQVCEQLGIENLDCYTGEEIKELLEKRTEEKEKSQ